MSLLKTNYANGVYPMPTCDDAAPRNVRMEYSLAAALALNDVIYAGDLPADHVPVDFMLDADDLDTNGAPAIILAVGIINATDNGLSTDAADGGAVWLAGSTIGQAGGLARPTTNVITRVTPTSGSRRVGVHVSTGPATGATTGKVGLTLTYRAANYGK